MLNLGDTLFQLRAKRADESSTLIQPMDLAQVLAAAEASDSTTVSLRPAPLQPIAAPSPPDVLRLELRSDGEIWLGDQLLPQLGRLTPLQRRLIDYLYANRHRLCSYQEIIDHVWASGRKPVDDDSLRKLVDRVIFLLEPDQKNPQYIQKMPGHFRLIHTVD